MASIGIPPHIVEAALNHVSGAKAGVAGTYNHAAYGPEKKAALERWAAHVEGVVSGGTANVGALKEGTHHMPRRALPVLEPDEIRRSPKGLLVTKTIEPHKHLRVEEVGPGAYTIGPKLEPRQEITNCISFWCEFAAAVIEASGKNSADYDAVAKSDVHDPACAAALVLKRLGKIEALLHLIERDFADRSPPILRALYQALLLASEVHALTIVDNEVDIASTTDRRRFLAENRAAKTRKATRQRGRWQAKAAEIWRKNPDWTAQRVGEEIAGTDDNPNTIRRLIKKTKKS